MNTLERAIEIAARAHAGQVDKAGQPHILHVLRVIMSPTLSDNKQRSVAALRDVVEDCPAWPLERLRRDFRGRDALTHRDREDCESFIRRASDRARGEVHDLRQGRSRLPEPSDVLYPLGRELRFAAEPHSALLRFGKSPPFCTKSFGQSRVENEIQQSKSAECVSHAVTHPAAARRLSDVHQRADLALP